MRAAGRRRARNTASDLVARGRRVMMDAVLPLRDAAQDNERARIGDFSQPTRGFAEAVTTAIDRFAAAVRHDPTNAEAWYHLAYFAGLAGDRDRQERAHQAFHAVFDFHEATVVGDVGDRAGHVTQGDRERLVVFDDVITGDPDLDVLCLAGIAGKVDRAGGQYSQIFRFGTSQSQAMSHVKAALYVRVQGDGEAAGWRGNRP